MANFGESLFSGDRRLFWCLAPLSFLVGCFFLGWAVVEFSHGTRGWFILLIPGFFGVFLALSLIDSPYFQWARRVLCALVIAWMIWPNWFDWTYWRLDNYSIERDLAIVLPCLWYVIFGRFSLKKPRRWGDNP